ncbi:MAG: 50S ribosomal protein L24 [Desulfobacteraceae bacterium]|nr:50S ribosomal protein L24 [Desulfobacteraceae bacterium]
MIKNKCHIKKDDKVKVITGKDKGKIGKVLSLKNKNSRIIIENINMMKKHARASAKHRQGGIIESESPIHWSNVMLMCSKCVTPVRIKMKRLEDGKKIRVCSRCNEIIDS